VSALLVISLIVALGVIFSQFGSRLQASRALGWYVFGVFLVVSAAVPSAWQPLVQVLGIQLVSNFVMAVAILFLIGQVLELGGVQATLQRKLRQHISNLAVDAYIQAADPAPEHGPRVLVVLPCFNEQEAIPAMAQKMRNLASEQGIRFCFVNDGSRDGSSEVLRRIAPKDSTTHSANIGVAGVLMTGFQIMLRSNYDYVIQCDGDGQHPVEQIPELIKVIVATDADLVVGSRFVKVGWENSARSLASTTGLRKFGSNIIRYTLSILWRMSGCTDPTSGFRIFSRRAAQTLLSSMPDEYPEPETLAILAMHGLKIREIYCEMQPRTTGVSSLHGYVAVRYMYKVVTALVGLRLRHAYRLVWPRFN
jgi:hypothetical protein